MNEINSIKRAYFNKLADEWQNRQVSENKIQKFISLISFKRGQCILDIGCGTGILAPLLNKIVNPGGLVLEMDFAQQMVLRAKQKFNISGVYFLAGNGETLPFSSGSFNHVICFASFPHFENKGQALGEIHRVLKVRGSLSIVHLMGSKELEELHQKIGGPIAEDLLPEKNKLQQMLRHAGFHDIYAIDKPEIFLAKAIKERD
jgi:ubiquinone/menaquinone biosynthesis C-methylase UbiE